VDWWIGGRSDCHALAGLAATLGIITLIMNKGDPQRIWEKNNINDEEEIVAIHQK
jgi:hypothetical protein